VTDDALGTRSFAVTGPDASRFEADATGLYLRAGTVLDFEGQAACAVTVVVSDPTLPGAAALSAPFTLTVTDVNEAPTGLVLDGARVAENAAVGAFVGTFAVADSDGVDAMTYALVAGEGDAGNGTFAIDGSRLVTAERLNFEEQSRYSIRVRATNATGASTEAVFTIDVTDDTTEAAVVEAVTLPAAGTYRAGQALVVAVAYSRPVTVRGMPSLRLRVGGRMRDAVYAGGSGSTVLTFAYRVATTDATERVALGSVLDIPRRAAITADGARVSEVLPERFRGLEAAGVVVDGVAPEIVGRVLMPRAGTYRPGQTLAFTVRFSEAVVVEGTPRIRLFIGASTREAEYVAGSGSRVLRFEYTVPAVSGRGRVRPLDVGQRILGGTITDVAGNLAQRDLTEPQASRVKVML
ncbi:MAG: cadherin repeat domain-containing protein, partial [Planctomycetaceae bacterium]